MNLSICLSLFFRCAQFFFAYYLLSRLKHKVGTENNVKEHIQDNSSKYLLVYYFFLGLLEGLVGRAYCLSRVTKSPSNRWIQLHTRSSSCAFWRAECSSFAQLVEMWQMKRSENKLEKYRWRTSNLFCQLQESCSQISQWTVFDFLILSLQITIPILRNTKYGFFPNSFCFFFVWGNFNGLFGKQ